MTCKGTCYSDEDGERLATDHRPGCATATGDGICGRKSFDFTCTLPRGHGCPHESGRGFFHTDEPMSEPIAYCPICKVPATVGNMGTPIRVQHEPGCKLASDDRCPWCEGSGYRTAYGPLRHLVLSWAARSLLTMTEGWRDRQMLMLGKPVNEATDEAANALHEQGFLANFPGTVISHGGIVLTDAGRDQLAEWDRLAAGVQ